MLYNSKGSIVETKMDTFKSRLLHGLGTTMIVTSVIVGFAGLIGMFGNFIFDGMAGSTKQYSSAGDPKLIMILIVALMISVGLFVTGKYLRNNNER